MNSYTNVFGNHNINPSLLSFIAYEITDNLALVWPFEAVEGSNVAADKIDINSLISNAEVSLPSAELVSVGYDLLFNNKGANAFTVVDFDGNTLINIPAGQQWYLYLTDNTTAAGTWDIVFFGSATSPATAADLAGYGLRARITHLDQNIPSTEYNTDQTFDATKRATSSISTGGVITFNFDDAALLGNGWLMYIRNAGTGDLTLEPFGAQTIDGAANKVLQPTESLIVFSDGTDLETVGDGRSFSNTVTFTSVNIAGSGTTVLTDIELAAQVQNFTGALTGNSFVEYGGNPGYWFVRNQTSVAHTVTFRTTGVDPGVVVPQGSFSILRSDGTTMSVALSTTVGTVTSVTAGTGLTAAPNPIVAAGTISLADTVVAPATYGAAGKIPHFTVDQQGRLTAAGEDNLSIANAQVVASSVLAGMLSDETGSAGGVVVFNNAPSIADANLTGNPVAPTPAPGDSDTSVATTAFVAAAIAAAIANNTFKTGDIKHTLNGTLDTGWLFLNGQSIGSATSGATGRANADTANLYAFFWNNYSNTLCPVSTGRGANAAADFAANKTLTMLDARGAVLAGADNMGTAGDAGKLGTGATGGFAGAATLGTSAGEKSHTDTIAEMPAHTHVGTQNGGDVALAGGTSAIASGNVTGSAGGGGAHNNVQWTLVCNVWVKL